MQQLLGNYQTISIHAPAQGATKALICYPIP